jgi:plasmid stabilization system protein ParE
MTEVEISPSAARDLERLTDFLLASDPVNAAETTDLILGALATLREHPAIGRTVEQGLRELVISRGRTGYIALYRFSLSRNLVRVLSVRHQRESTDA